MYRNLDIMSALLRHRFLKELFAAGSIKVVGDRRCRPEETADAHWYVEEEHRLETSS
jgi:hypothetical protein